MSQAALKAVTYPNRYPNPASQTNNFIDQYLIRAYQHNEVIAFLNILEPRVTAIESGSVALSAVDLNGNADALILDADADTTISAPTDDQIDFELRSKDQVVFKAEATADAGVTTNIVEIILDTPVDTTGTNEHNALNIDIGIGNATGGTNTVNAIKIDNITGDAQVTETGILLGTGFDIGLDMQGTKLELDADNDTSIIASTDDQIDIEVAGAIDFVITANTFTASAGSTIATDTIAETTGAAGVTVDSLLIKDGGINGAGTLVTTNTTDATTKDTGSIITEGGIGVEKALVTGTGITAGTTLTVGTDQNFAKEVDHTIQVVATTTANTVGGSLDITAGNGLGSGNGGALYLSSGVAGATGNGGSVTLEGQAGGLTSGDGGDIAITGGAASVGTSGGLTLSSGNTASGVAGDIILTTGTHTSATVSPIISLNKAVVRKPNSSTVASGGTITGPELVGGLIAATGATGNWQLPTAAQITTAIGATPAGTNFEFVFNAQAMTGTNTATLVVGANMSVASAPAITGGGTLTVTQDTQVTGGFRIVFDTATTCKIYRIW